MSREIGGRADKDGNEFERLWVVDQAFRVLDGKAVSLQWEPPGQIAYGLELEVALSGGNREVHQSKIENGLKGEWTAAGLNAAGVLKAALLHLQRPGVSAFVFVSRDPAASALRDLVERAHRTGDDPEVFFETALSATDHRRELEYLCKAWELDLNQAAERARVFGLLGSLRFEPGIWDSSQRRRLELAAGLLAEGEGRDIVDRLGNSLSQNLGQTIHADQIRAYLRESGHPPRDLRADPRVPAGIERLQRSFEDSLRGLLLGGDLLPRTETQELLRLLAAAEGPRIVFLHGPAGIGKSDVEMELTRTLAERGTPFLPVRFDSQPPRGSLSSYSRDVLELPADPVDCLSALAGERPAVLLIDQLDAIRWTGGHSAEALRIVREMLKAALSTETVRIVIACRTFDLENDFKKWEQEHSDRSQRIEVKPLRDEEVRSFMERQGAPYEDLNSAQRELLRTPYMLFLWWELYRDRREFPSSANRIGLLSEYRDHLIRRLDEMGQPEAPVLLEELVAYLDRHGRLDAPAALVGRRTGAREALQSLSVLREPRHGFLTFAHQSLLDFLIAERVAREALSGNASPVDWLRHNEQSLFRRDQLRQLLTLLRDQEPSLYNATLSEILTGEGIRFHLQHLALGILHESPSPSQEELGLVRHLLAMEAWRPHALGQIALGSKVWLERLDDAGVFADWLASEDPQLLEGAFQACRALAPHAPERIEGLLGPLWDEGDETQKNRIDAALGHRLDFLTDRMTEWRLTRARCGARRIDWFDVDDLAVYHPTRAVMLFEAHLLHTLDLLEGPGDPDFAWRDRSRGPLEHACKSAPIEAWQRLLPVLLRSIGLFKKNCASRKSHSAQRKGATPRCRALGQFTYQVRRLLSVAGAELADRERLAVVDRLVPLISSRSRSIFRLILAVLLKGPDDLGDFALQWLYLDSRRLRSASYRDTLRVRRLIERFAGVCSSEVFEELERHLMAFHPQAEMEAVRHHKEMFSPAKLLRPHEYGRTQHLLLSALPQDRVSAPARSRLAAWDRKFGKPESRGRIRQEGGIVRSPIPSDRLRLIPDKQWLSIISRDWDQKTRSTWRRDFLTEASHGQFARDFGAVARFEPDRFIGLALQVSPSAPRVYFSALLNALSEKPPRPEEGVRSAWRPAPIERVEELLRHIESLLEEQEIAWAVCQLIRTLATEPWSDWILDLLRGYVERHAERTEISAHLNAEEDDEEASIDVAVEESTRGAAAEALMTLWFARPDLTDALLPTVELLASDPGPVARVAAQCLSLPLWKTDPDRAIRLFLESCTYPDDRVLRSSYTDRFLGRTWNRKPIELAPVLSRMIESTSEKLAQRGAFWATAGYIAKGFYSELAARCLAGSKAHREGAAEAMAELLPWPEARQAALRGLQDLLRDEDGPATVEVASLLRDEEVLASPEGPILAEAYFRSPAMLENPGDLFYGLRKFTGSLVPYAPILREVIQRLGELSSATRDASTRLFGAVTFLPEVLLRLYEQAEGPELTEVRKLCLDAWDALLRGQVGLSANVLRKLDA